MRRFLVLSTLLLAGCASPGLLPAGRPSLAVVQDAAASPQVTQAAGNSLLNQAGGPYTHQPVEAIVQETLNDLIRAAGAGSLPGTVIILNSPGYNAHALPNGQIFVTRGLLALANDQAELAAALAHELGHVIARHAAQRIVERANAAADAVAVARASGDIELMRAAIVSRRQSLAAFSRQQEIEADRIGVELLAKAGYDPRAALRITEGLERLSVFNLRRARVEPVQRQNALGSHPPTPERLAALRAVIQKTPASGERRTGRERYLAAVAGMAFGEDGRAGFVRGRIYMHPGLDIAMTLPPGYVLNGARATVSALNQGGKTAMLFTRLPAQAAADPEAALRQMMAAASQPAVFEPLPGGALRGAVALTRNGKAAARTAVFETGGKAFRVIMATKDYDASFERDTVAVLSSVRALNQRDHLLARPLNIRIERASGAGALRQFAERAGNAENGAELILALNGVRSAADLRPGAPIKVPGLQAE